MQKTKVQLAPKHGRPERLFRAMADPTRLAILQLLLPAGSERCVCELVDALAVPQPTASRHLAYLRLARLVEARKQGQWSYYRLSHARTPLHRQLLACLDCCGAVLARPTTGSAVSLCCPRPGPAAESRTAGRARAAHAMSELTSTLNANSTSSKGAGRRNERCC